MGETRMTMRRSSTPALFLRNESYRLSSCSSPRQVWIARETGTLLGSIMSAMIHVFPLTCNGKHHCSNSNPNHSMSCFMNTIARSHQRHDFASVSCITNRKCDSQSKLDDDVERLSQYLILLVDCVCRPRDLHALKSLLNSMRHLRASHVSCPAHPQRIPFLTKSLLSRVFRRLCTSSCNLMTNGYSGPELDAHQDSDSLRPQFLCRNGYRAFLPRGKGLSPLFIISRKIPS